MEVGKIFQVRQISHDTGRGTPRRLGARPSARNINYARMYHFEKKNSKIYFPDGPRENVLGPRKNVSQGPAVALDGPGLGS